MTTSAQRSDVWPDWKLAQARTLLRVRNCAGKPYVVRAKVSVHRYDLEESFEADPMRFVSRLAQHCSERRDQIVASVIALCAATTPQEGQPVLDRITRKRQA